MSADPNPAPIGEDDLPMARVARARDRAILAVRQLPPVDAQLALIYALASYTRHRAKTEGTTELAQFLTGATVQRTLVDSDTPLVVPIARDRPVTITFFHKRR